MVLNDDSKIEEYWRKEYMKTTNWQDFHAIGYHTYEYNSIVMLLPCL